MANLKNTIISDTGFLQLPVGTTAQRPTAANGQLRWNSSTGSAEFYTTGYSGKWEQLTVPFQYRTIITTAYVVGGYKDAVTWRNVNRTVAATDTTTDLGDQIERSFNYKCGLVGLDRVTVFGAANAHAAASNLSTMFNMRTETTFTTPSRANMALSRGHGGTLFKEHLIGWITGGGEANNATIEGYLMPTDTIFSTGLSSGITGTAGGSGGGPWGAVDENYGIWYTGEGGGLGGAQQNFSFGTQTLSTRTGTQVGAHYQQKTIHSKVGRTYAGNEGSYNGGFNYRRTTFSTNTTSGSAFAKSYSNMGEENYTLGNDWQYMLGQYNGAQNNLSAKFVYATETQTNGGSTLEPKGPAGRSSAVTGWRS
jgi:hypothetical protein